MKWTDDAGDDWRDAPRYPPIVATGFNPRHAAVGLADLVVDLDDCQ